MRRAMGNLPTDEDGRLVLRMGGPCRVCGREAASKCSTDGRVVLYHLHEDCVRHTTGRKWTRSDSRYADREEA